MGHTILPKGEPLEWPDGGWKALHFCPWTVHRESVCSPKRPSAKAFSHWRAIYPPGFSQYPSALPWSCSGRGRSELTPTRGAHCLPRSSLCRKARIWIGCCSARLLAWRSPSSGLPTFCGRRTSLFQDSYWPETLRALPIFAICTCLRCAFPQSNHGRTPETCRRLDAPRLGISEGFQRGPRPTSEKAGKVPGRTSLFRVSLFIANPHAIAPKTGVDRCFREPSMKGRAACGTWLYHRRRVQWCSSTVVVSATGYIAL